MASASSMGEADSKFPGSTHQDAIPPSPTRENPAGVYPKSDPSPAPSGSIPGTGPPAPSQSRSSPLGNPYLLRSVLDDLDSSLGRAIEAVRKESTSASGGGPGDVLGMFEGWRRDLDAVRAGEKVGSGAGSTGAGAGGRGRKMPEEDPSSAESGGMFKD